MWLKWAIVLILFVFLPKHRRLLYPSREGAVFGLFFLCLKDFAKFWFNFNPAKRYREHQRKDMKTLYVTYHSRCSLDLFLIVASLRPTVLVSFFFFKVPVISWLARCVGAIPSKSQRDGKEAEDGFINHLRSTSEHARPILLVPGGTHEFAKTTSERYTVCWKEIPGFARVLHEHKMTNIQIIPVFVPNCESIYHTSMDSEAYDNTSKRLRQDLADIKHGAIHRIPTFTLRALSSIGYTLLPRRVQLGLCFGEAVHVKAGEAPISIAERTRESLQELISRSQRDPEYTTHEGGPKPAGNIILPQHHFFMAIYTVIQNGALLCSVFVCVLSAALPLTVYGHFLRQKNA